jgi:hypothetical protein
MQKRCTVRYQVATYSGEVVVWADEDDDDEVVAALAADKLRRHSGGSLPYGVQSFHVVDRVDAHAFVVED